MSARCTICKATAEKNAAGSLVIKHADDCPENYSDNYCEGCERVGLLLNEDFYCLDCIAVKP